MNNSIRFTRNLVKGRIAETVFAQMLRDCKKFTVLEFGYEKIIPELVQQGYDKNNITIETLKTAPDFAVINQETKEVRLIEIKYLKKLNYEYVLEYAKKMHQSWNPSYLFIATLSGFYFNEINTVIKNNGKIFPLSDEEVKGNVQKKYLEVLSDFEKHN